MDNLGQISIYTLPTLRRQILFSCIKASDITALSSVQFSPHAHALYLQSSSELAQVTFSPQTILPYSMSISYDKLQRKTIQRQTSPLRSELNGHDVLLSSPSKLSEHAADESTITSASEKQEETPLKKPNDKNKNNGYDVVDRDLPSFQSTPLRISTDPLVQKDHQNSISPVSPNGKLAGSSAKLISIKVHQAPTLNQIHYYNGSTTNNNNNNSTSPSQRSPAIHT